MTSSTKQLNTRGRMARWMVELNKYEYEIIHKPGKENEQADALSRIQRYPETCKTEILSEETQLREEQEEDEELKEIIDFFTKGNTPKGMNAIKLSQNFTQLWRRTNETCYTKSTEGNDPEMHDGDPRQN